MAKIEDLTMDKRIVDRNLEKGLVTRDELDKHIAGLPDLTDKSEYISVDTPEELEPASPPDDEDAPAAAAPVADSREEE